MRGILEKLYEGDVRPAETFKLETAEYRRAKAEFDKRFEVLYKELPPGSKAQYLELEGKYNDMLFLEFQETFVKGFRLGADIIMAVCDYPSDASRQLP